MPMGFLIWHVNLRWRTAVDRALAPVGLTATQYAVLASLHGLSRDGTRPSQRDLADFAGLEPMYVSKLVRALANSGLLARERDPADTRAVRLAITDAGHEAVTAARSIILRVEAERLAVLGGRESVRSAELRAMLLALLDEELTAR